MRVMIEENDDWDYLEIVLTPQEIDQLQDGGISKEFEKGFFRQAFLNVLIRKETNLKYIKDDYANEERPI